MLVLIVRTDPQIARPTQSVVKRQEDIWQKIVIKYNDGRTDPEVPIIWPSDAKNRITGKDPDAGKDWGQEKGATEDEMVGWHHWHNGHEFEQTPENSEAQGSLMCCSPQGCRQSDPS